MTQCARALRSLKNDFGVAASERSRLLRPVRDDKKAALKAGKTVDFFLDLVPSLDI